MLRNIHAHFVYSLTKSYTNRRIIVVNLLKYIFDWYLKSFYHYVWQSRTVKTSG